jgi:shikimate kinase
MVSIIAVLIINLVISLVGLPGSGKSTVGRQLARRLGLPFIDSDPEIERRIGCTIREYFEREGEDSFRDAEEATIAELTQLVDSTGVPVNTRCVLSTGGGTVLRQANRDRLRASGYVIYLRSNPEEVFKRLRHDRNRPLLQVGDPLQRLKDLFAVRDPLYRETAHFVIETGRPSVATLVNMIVMQLELAGALPSSG